MAIINSCNCKLAPGQNGKSKHTYCPTESHFTDKVMTVWRISLPLLKVQVSWFCWRITYSPRRLFWIVLERRIRLTMLLIYASSISKFSNHSKRATKELASHVTEMALNRLKKSPCQLHCWPTWVGELLFLLDTWKNFYWVLSLVKIQKRTVRYLFVFNQKTCLPQPSMAFYFSGLCSTLFLFWIFLHAKRLSSHSWLLE